MKWAKKKEISRGGIQAEEVRRGSHSVGRCGTSKSRDAAWRKAVKSFESRKEQKSLNRLIWSRCSIAPTYPSRSHFQRTLNRENGTKVRMNVAAHQKK